MCRRADMLGVLVAALALAYRYKPVTVTSARSNEFSYADTRGSDTVTRSITSTDSDAVAGRFAGR